MWCVIPEYQVRAQHMTVAGRIISSYMISHAIITAEIITVLIVSWAIITADIITHVTIARSGINKLGYDIMRYSIV